jgi:hypothetical protein
LNKTKKIDFTIDSREIKKFKIQQKKIWKRCFEKLVRVLPEKLKEKNKVK